MPRISKGKRDKISEQILHHLFEVSPEAKFTSDIAVELARDEEFIKSLLLDLKEKDLVNEIKKNSSGEEYTRRRRWRLSNQAYAAYSKHQSNQKAIPQNNNIYIQEDVQNEIE